MDLIFNLNLKKSSSPYLEELFWNTYINSWKFL